MEKVKATEKKHSFRKAWSNFVQSLDKKLQAKAKEGSSCCAPADKKERKCCS